MRDKETPLISVVIPCFCQARFLGKAIESALAQSCQDFEIIVIDDGSTDDTPEVARQYDQVRCFRQANQGLSAARNAGIEASQGRYLVFLDADDRLLPDALAAGLQCFAEHPNCAFVSGGYHRIDEAGAVIEQPTPAHVLTDHYMALLAGNYVGMHGAVMYKRSAIVSAGGFRSTLRACEDYDLYLRLARVHPVACHSNVVAEYRTHAKGMSTNTGLMLSTVLRVLRSQRKHLGQDPRAWQAYSTGVRYWKTFYAHQLIDQMAKKWKAGEYREILKGAMTISFLAAGPFWQLAYQRWVRPTLPTSLLRLAASVRRRPYYPSVGRVRFGDLRRVSPISEWFGFDRGLPIDRYYIEQFLAAQVDDIRGRVLEIGDAKYTRRFGGTRVARSDVLHVTQGNPQATIVGDLALADQLTSNQFDCVIVTQTVHLIYEVRSALNTLYQSLTPGGVLLITVPGISPISKDEWGKSWYWGFTSLSLRRLLEEFFPPECIQVTAHGNVFATIVFLQGIAAGELTTSELEHRDPSYEMLITARAAKPAQAIGDDVSL